MKCEHIDRPSRSELPSTPLASLIDYCGSVAIASTYLPIRGVTGVEIRWRDETWSLASGTHSCDAKVGPSFSDRTRAKY